MIRIDLFVVQLLWWVFSFSFSFEVGLGQVLFYDVMDGVNGVIILSLVLSFCMGVLMNFSYSLFWQEYFGLHI